ncbi:MAG: hypothetical protein MJ107_01835 [Lachnospiraceae bacterium]|nr:hypothetical protein [Lachnospiraceae bacterium]
MNKKSLFLQITAYVLTIIIVFAVIISHGTMTIGRFFLAIMAVLAGAAFIYFCSKKADENTSIRNILEQKVLGLSVCDIISFLLVTTAAIVIRFTFYPFISADTAIFQQSWYDTAKAAGISSLGMRIGNYPPLYMTVFCILAQFFPMMFVVKFIPIIFDFIIAVFGLKIYCLVCGKQTAFKKLIVYSVLLLNPISVLNASAWGQSDSLYTGFIMIFIYSLIKLYEGSYTNGDLVFIFLGLAFACKFQTVLILPVILLLWIIQKQRKISITYFIWIPIMYFATCIPMFLFHRTLGDLIGVYLFQVNQYKTYLSQNYANLYSLIGNTGSELSEGSGKFGMFLGIAVLFILYLYFFKKNIDITSEFILNVTAFTVLTLAFFLPSMHERYAIVGEVIILIIACIKNKYLPEALATVLCTTFSYTKYLLYNYELSLPPEWLVAIVRLVILIVLLRKMFLSDNPVQEGSLYND